MTIVSTSSAPNTRLPACITTGSSAGMRSTSSQASSAVTKTPAKKAVPRPTARIRAYAAAKLATRNMLVMSR